MRRKDAGLILVCGVALMVRGGPAGADPEASGLKPLVELLGRVDDASVQRDVLRGVQEALAGSRHVAMPAEWPAVYRKLAASPLPEVRDRARDLAVLFGDEQALAALRKVVADAAAPADARRGAMEALLATKDPRLVPLLQRLVSDRAIRASALRALAAYGDERTPGVILRAYAGLSDEEKADAIQTLASRPSYALALLGAVESGGVPRRDLSAFTIRQMMALHNAPVDQRLAKVWGVVRPASQEKAALMSRYKSLLTPDSLKVGDRAHGRLIFSRTCGSCHRLFDAGGDVGPELTGSQRANLDYVLDNVLDPSAIVPQDYQVTVIETRDGRVLTGIIKQETDKTLTVQTQNDRLIVPKGEIESRARSPLSMMPEGLLANLKNEDVRDLVAYLASPAQVPLPREEAGHR